MDRTLFELREALSEPGCFLCRLEEDHTRRFLDTLFYEFVTDCGVREKIRSGGFCKTHTERLFLLRPSILGIAIVYQDLLEQYLASHEVPNPQRCLVCQDWEEHLAHLIHLLTTHLEDLTPAWGEETFLCLPHLARLPEPLKGALANQTRKTLRRIADHLLAFITKFDYHKSGLPVEPQEARSWQEAMEFFAGNLMGKRRR